MIFDSLKNSSIYYALSPRFRKALEYLVEQDLTLLGAGKHQIADDVYALVSTYETKKPEVGVFEVHQQYADIQLVTSGEELIGYASDGGQEVVKAYDSEHDYALYKGSPTFFKLVPGMIAIFLPGELHMPGIGEESSQVKKIVVKVKI